MSPTISVLVPWRSDHGHRERVWQWLEPEWRSAVAEVGGELVIGEDPRPERPFSAARAFNAALARARAPIVAAIGADMMPSAADLAAYRHIIDRGPVWAHLYDRITYLAEDSTEACLRGDMRAVMRWSEEIRHRPEGVFAARRFVLEDVGGWDERFEGWGWEDTALYAALGTLHGPPATLGGVLGFMWHPDGHRDLSAANPNRQLFEREYAPAIGDPPRMREVIRRG